MSLQENMRNKDVSNAAPGISHCPLGKEMMSRYEIEIPIKKERDAAIGSLGAPKYCVIVLGIIGRIQRLVVESSRAAITSDG